MSTVNEAFELRAQNPEFVLIGEVNGYPIEGFDLPNSPSVIEGLNFTNQRLVLRTTAGTQGVVLAAHTEHLYVASLCVATATAKSLKTLNPEAVTFVETGVRSKGGGEEDIACSDYISSLLKEAPLSVTSIQTRVRASRAAAKFSDSENSDFPESDLEHALKIDRFVFAMKIVATDHRLTLKTVSD